MQVHQQQFINGTPQTPGFNVGYRHEFPHPVNFAPPLNPSSLVAQQTFMVDYNHKIAYTQKTEHGDRSIAAANFRSDQVAPPAPRSDWRSRLRRWR
jgi:hypothetical protein